MSVKIVHAADFHLDSAFGALSAEQARQRRRESRELLTRLSNYVNQNGVDLVLLAGDLFDSDTTYRETLEALSEALGAMQARVFIAPGNPDPSLDGYLKGKEFKSAEQDRKSTRLNSSHRGESRMPSSA